MLNLLGNSQPKWLSLVFRSAQRTPLNDTSGVSGCGEKMSERCASLSQRGKTNKLLKYNVFLLFWGYLARVLNIFGSRDKKLQLIASFAVFDIVFHLHKAGYTNRREIL